MVAGDNNEDDDDEEDDDEDDDVASFNFFDSGLASVAAVPIPDAAAAPPSKAREAR
jgi:hypothetical protein